MSTWGDSESTRLGTLGHAMAPPCSFQEDKAVMLCQAIEVSVVLATAE